MTSPLDVAREISGSKAQAELANECLRRLYNKYRLMDRLSYFVKYLFENRGYHFLTWVDSKLLDLKDMVLFID